MSDPLRTDGFRPVAGTSEADRDAKIEQLLLAGLDHYFAAQYDHAISVWTRVLFLDRSHARARAYIDRARSAQAERQRQSEELLQSGVAALNRGDGDEARRLVRAAIDTGVPPDEAFAVLARLERLPGRAAGIPSAQRLAQTAAPPGPPASGSRARSVAAIVLWFAATVAAAGGYSVLVWGPLDWGTLSSFQPESALTAPLPASDMVFAPPRRGELAFARAQMLAAGGRLGDALAALDLVRATDPEKGDADRLRAELQVRLFGLPSAASQPAEKGDRSAP